MTKIQQMIPIFRSFDETKAKEFYVDYLGGRIAFEHRLDESSPLYFGVILGTTKIGGDGGAAGGVDHAEIHLSEHHGDATPGSSIRLEMEDIEAFHAMLAAKKYKNARPGLEHQPWGYLEVKITDPFGNTLIFCQLDESVREARKKRGMGDQIS